MHEAGTIYVRALAIASSCPATAHPPARTMHPRSLTSSPSLMPAFCPHRCSDTELARVAVAHGAHRWLDELNEARERRLHNARDPRVVGSSTRANAGLRKAGIERISDLSRFTDKELLAIPGVGKKAVEKWRRTAELLSEVS